MFEVVLAAPDTATNQRIGNVTNSHFFRFFILFVCLVVVLVAPDTASECASVRGAERGKEGRGGVEESY